MKAAALTSPRLRRVLDLLSDGRPRTTLQIVRGARVMAVSACVSELRQHGAEIACVQGLTNEQRVWIYTMTKAPILK